MLNVSFFGEVIKWKEKDVKVLIDSIPVSNLCDVINFRIFFNLKKYLSIYLSIYVDIYIIYFISTHNNHSITYLSIFICVNLFFLSLSVYFNYLSIYQRWSHIF